MSAYTLITDGAYSSAKDQGGIGIVFLKEGKPILEHSKMYKGVTNNQMELGAIIIGLRLIKKPIDSLNIVTDSMYCIGCATKGWKRKKNVRLWEEFDKQYKRVSELCPSITFTHTRGHQTDSSEFTKWNNYCDKLAVKASQRI